VRETIPYNAPLCILLGIRPKPPVRGAEAVIFGQDRLVIGLYPGIFEPNAADCAVYAVTGTPEAVAFGSKVVTFRALADAFTLKVTTFGAETGAFMPKIAAVEG
jgi:hypothetical protein